MTRIAALAHVVRYDARRMQRWWLAYSTVLAVAAVSPAVFRGIKVGQYEPLWGYTTFLLPLTGLVFALALGQGDGAYDARGFLRAKPVSDPTRAAARLVHLLALALFTVAVIVLGLWHGGIGMPVALSLAASAVVPYFLLLLYSTSIGASTRSLSSGLLLLFVAFLLLFPIGMFGLDLTRSLLSRSVLLSLAVIMLWLTYMGRVTWRQAVTISMGLFTLAYGGWCARVVDPLDRVPSNTPPINERVRFGAFPDSIGERDALPYTIEGARADRLYWVPDASIMPYGSPSTSAESSQPIRLGYGNTLRVEAFAVSPAMLPGLEGFVWAPPLPPGASSRPLSGMAVGDMRADARIRDVKEVTVAAQLKRYRAEPLVTVPIALGTWYEGGGQSLSMVVDRGLPVLEERQSPRSGGAPLDFDRDNPSSRFDIVVIDSTTRTAHLLQPRERTGSQAVYILPTIGFQVMRTEFQQQELLRALMRPGSRSSAIVYRWIEEGHSGTSETRMVQRWPIGPDSLGQRGLRAMVEYKR